MSSLQTSESQAIWQGSHVAQAAMSANFVEAYSRVNGTLKPGANL